jgi:hypothetical protein
VADMKKLQISLLCIGMLIFSPVLIICVALHESKDEIGRFYVTIFRGIFFMEGE